MSNKHRPTRTEFVKYYPITTRWMDNDVFGHVNNVQYYSYYDTVINRFLLEESDVNFLTGDIAAFIVHSQCFYHQSFAYPDNIEGAVKINKIGNSSVEYGVAIFLPGTNECAAHGTMTHVFVNKSTQKPIPIPDSLRQVFSHFQ